MGHSSMRAALIYLHANRGASKAIAAGIDRQLAEAAQQQDASGADDDAPSGMWLARQRRPRVRRQAGEWPGSPSDQHRSSVERVTGIEPA
jgi:hypothetical protein